SSSADVIGGHTNLAVNHQSAAKTTICTSSVALIFTLGYSRDKVELSALERVGEGEHHGDTDADQEGRVDQAGEQEHLGLQLVHQFRLAGSAFDVLAAHVADADTRAHCAQADDQTA